MKLFEKNIIQGLIIFSIGVVVIVLLFGDKGIVQYSVLKKQETQLMQEIESLTQEREEWISKIHSLKANRTYMETIAREELGMVHNTEIMIRLRYE